MARLYGRAGRLTAQNGGFWSGQTKPIIQLSIPFGLYFQKYPNPESDRIINFRKLMYPFLFLTVLFINLQATLTQLGQERERGIKDALGLKVRTRAACHSALADVVSPYKREWARLNDNTPSVRRACGSRRSG
jgi:hypothetical protein